MKRSLPASKGFVELGAAIVAEESLLLLRYDADITATTRIDGMELESEDCWLGRCDDGGGGFVTEELPYYVLLNPFAMGV